MSVMDNTIRIIPCFDEMELQIRVHSYNYTCREGGYSRSANPNHQDIPLAELISQFNPGKEEDTFLRDDYMAWWRDERDWRVYRRIMESAYNTYRTTHSEYSDVEIRELTPSQINELHKKVQNPDFVLDLGDVP